MTRTIWLACYPKSGNTWLRILIANLSANADRQAAAFFREGGVDGWRQAAAPEQAAQIVARVAPS